MTKTLHIAPGESAAFSLREALRIAGRDDGLLACRDDLSCGPIDPGTPEARAAWWQDRIDWPEIETDLRSFWAQVRATDDRIVIWFGRHSARELAFRLAWAWHMAGRPYEIVDVTALPIRIRRPDGTEGGTRAGTAASLVPEEALAALFGSERPAVLQEEMQHRQAWEHLRRENAPFRIVTADGLTSAPLDHFDQLLLDQAGPEWREVAFVVGRALGLSFDPYQQVSDLTLVGRVMDLVDQGKLIAEGEPWNMRGKLRLP